MSRWVVYRIEREQYGYLDLITVDVEHFVGSFASLEQACLAANAIESSAFRIQEEPLDVPLDDRGFRLR
jgi:hypothetical protein